MKTNSLINEIIRGTWFLNINNLDAYAPLVQNILAGKTAVPQGREFDILSYYDDEGEPVTKGAEQQEAQKVAVVSMIGPIMKYGDMCTYGADEIVNALDRANNNPNVKGIVFYIDGPGGSTAAIAPFTSFAARKKKPVVVLADSAYSLHYWTAVSVGDHIMADNNIQSGFGSVGVYISFADAKKYYEDKGIKIHEIYADQSEHKNEAFRLALEGEYDKIKKEMLNPLAQKFQEGVKAARGSKLKADAEGVLTGKTFYAEEALKLGMIDSIGDMGKAIQMVNALAEIKSIQ